MTETDNAYGESQRRSGGMFWFWAPLLTILFVGVAFSLLALAYADGLTLVQALAAGFGGVAALLVAVAAAIVSALVGLIATLFGVAAAGGAVAFAMFIFASPLIAIVLLFFLLRRRKSQCPDPSVH